MRVLGMMSGTSVDAIDVAIASFHAAPNSLTIHLEWHGEYPWPEQLRTQVLDVLPPAKTSVDQWCRLDTHVGQMFGEAASWAIDKAGPVDLIACHGQTLFHWVEDNTALGTLQIGNPAWIQGRTNTPVIHNFRTADIVAGGHGAPLVSTWDAMWLQGTSSAALNIGGIANATIVLDDYVVAGDIGPGNCLLDSSAFQQYGQYTDHNGRLAAAGKVHEEYLATLLSDPFFALSLPKSTGREYFHTNYLHERLGDHDLQGPDLFATLTEFSARAIAQTINAQGVKQVVASGGGVKNPILMKRLRENLSVALFTTDELGLPSDAKEAYAFALLGFLAKTGRSGIWQNRNGHCLTGAAYPSGLGSMTPPVNLAQPVGLPKLSLHPMEDV